MKEYLDLLELVSDKGNFKSDRTGTGTLSVFGAQQRFDISGDNFPLLTTKKMHIKSIIHELLWFLKGDTNTKYLNEKGVTIWDEWADENGDLGRVYGAQWKDWGGVFVKRRNNLGECRKSWEFKRRTGLDQIGGVIEDIKKNPDSRRLIVSAWNPGELDQMALPPCHALFQFFVQEGELSCQLYQRSCDLFLGVPFNIASYALLTKMVAQVTDLKPGEFIHTYGDLHIYSNHLNQVNEQLSREPRPGPKMVLNPERRSIDDFVFEDFELQGYNPHPGIKAPIAV